MVLISIVNELFRGLPALGPSFLLIYYNYNNDIMLLYIFMGSIFILFINFIMKDIIFKYIEYIINYYNFTNLKLICGNFERPPQAKNCGIVYLNEKNFSYERGMPSGHSLVAAYLATCLYFYIIHKYKIKKKIIQIYLLYVYYLHFILCILEYYLDVIHFNKQLLVVLLGQFMVIIIIIYLINL